MDERTLHAQALVTAAAELGVTIDDLVQAAAALEVRTVHATVAEFVATIAPTFSPNTAATYDTYWRLAIARFGERRVGEITVEDCAAVVAEAEERAQDRRWRAGGRSLAITPGAVRGASVGRTRRTACHRCVGA